MKRTKKKWTVVLIKEEKKLKINKVVVQVCPETSKFYYRRFLSFIIDLRVMGHITTILHESCELLLLLLLLLLVGGYSHSAMALQIP